MNTLCAKYVHVRKSTRPFKRCKAMGLSTVRLGVRHVQGLYEQFRRIANFYFLIIAIISLTPVRYILAPRLHGDIKKPNRQHRWQQSVEQKERECSAN